MDKFWPGPMTLLLKRTDKAKDFITGGQGVVGLRVP
ncbi:MAG: Sua5/YciO/YrdC/YwlC family protein, partial [Actinomycetota bacterium]